MPFYTKTDDGDILFPKRGNPPLNPDPIKYEATDDPYVFKLRLPPCNYRHEKITLLPCGKTSKRLRCDFDEQIADYMKCSLCPFEQEK